MFADHPEPIVLLPVIMHIIACSYTVRVMTTQALASHYFAIATMTTMYVASHVYHCTVGLTGYE